MFPLANVIQSAFSPLITLFESIMVFIHNDVVGGSWGLAIVGLTVLIRAILVPLTYRQLKGMQELQRLAPQMTQIKEKYKEDKQRQQQELMKFYQENKVNPLASCLPLILQLPVFISLFYMLRTDLKKHICGNQLVRNFNLHHPLHVVASASSKDSTFTKYIEKTSCNTVAPHSAKFLFLPDITNKATGAALIVLIVLYVGSQLASTFIATATADANQRRLMLFLPIIFVVILYRYPAGLLVYWITTNLWTIVQQFVIKRRLPPVKHDAAPASNGKPKASLRQALADATAARAPAGAGASAGSSAGVDMGPAAPPPRPPRKKKKRSGRRR